MVFKLFNKNKELNALRQWENQVKNTKKLKEKELLQVASPLNPTTCNPSDSYVREDSYENSHVVHHQYSDDKDLVQEACFRDSEETREVNNIGHCTKPTVSEAEGLDDGQLGPVEYEYPTETVVKNKMETNSDDTDKLVYLYNELLSNPLLTCMTLPILPCLGLYAKIVQPSVSSMKGQSHTEFEEYDMQDSQDDISPIDSAEKFSIEEEEEEIYIPRGNPSPYAPGNTNYSIGSPSIEDFGSGEVSFEESQSRMGDGYEGYYNGGQRYIQEMRYDNPNKRYHMYGDYTDEDIYIYK